MVWKIKKFSLLATFKKFLIKKKCVIYPSRFSSNQQESLCQILKLIILLNVDCKFLHREHSTVGKVSQSLVIWKLRRTWHVLITKHHREQNCGQRMGLSSVEYVISESKRLSSFGLNLRVNNSHFTRQGARSDKYAMYDSRQFRTQWEKSTIKHEHLKSSSFYLSNFMPSRTKMPYLNNQLYNCFVFDRSRIIKVTIRSGKH